MRNLKGMFAALESSGKLVRRVKSNPKVSSNKSISIGFGRKIPAKWPKKKWHITPLYTPKQYAEYIRMIRAL